MGVGNRAGWLWHGVQEDSVSMRIEIEMGDASVVYAPSRSVLMQENRLATHMEKRSVDLASKLAKLNKLTIHHFSNIETISRCHKTVSVQQ
jgi:hypothetical protein